MRIFDLHCDLLSYLVQSSRRTVDDVESRCSIPQMQKGGVAFQTLAIFTETGPGSSQRCAQQLAIFQKILRDRPLELCQFAREAIAKKHLGQQPISLLLAIENASGLLEEDEDLTLCFNRLDRMLHEIGNILYISLTWNTENRFGGGNATSIGLKRDGEALLDFLDEKRIAIDLSHTSDWLAHDILDYIDRKGLDIQPIASHSNFRKVTDVPRNLPDELAKEIIRRKGIIGMNCIRRFIGQQQSDFLKHLEHGIILGGENALGFGADFFSDIDTLAELAYLKPYFFSGFDYADCYPKLLDLFRQQFQEDFLRKLAHGNVENFFSRHLKTS